ncbi:hypothetical protein FGO68_gene2178 [Halteria grandinella]|uniref:Uncharacterized protein n=1 Tax=Halteria grandinella TaxID=5974 RepID=A0A8J8P4Y0_HALGN|nr:hypothetical protein FGO68_gene2178 [Halteria grandinella]
MLFLGDLYMSIIDDANVSLIDFFSICSRRNSFFTFSRGAQNLLLQLSLLETIQRLFSSGYYWRLSGSLNLKVLK